MKNKTFIILTWFHLIFVTFAFLVYFPQYCLYNGEITEGVARFYAMSLFIPNIIGIAIFYTVYVVRFLRNPPHGEEAKELKLHIAYNIFFLSGFLLEFFRLKNATLGDSLFIAAELAAIYLACIIISNNKNKKIWNC